MPDFRPGNVHEYGNSWVLYLGTLECDSGPNKEAFLLEFLSYVKSDSPSVEVFVETLVWLTQELVRMILS